MRKFLKKAEGFTLVELIVVIAILGILAGVGTVGYSGYVKSAQKKADQTLVSNIVRAIETGVNSTAFVPPASLSISATQYPIGFIVLNNNGTSRVLTSNSEFVQNVTGQCDIRTITVAYAASTNQEYTCPTISYSKSMPVYQLATKEVTCCLTHSEFVDTTSDVATNFATGYVHTCNKSESCAGTTCNNFNKFDPNGTLTVPAGTQYYVADESKLYGVSSDDASMCELAYANQTGSFVRPEAAEGEEVQYTRVNGNHVLNRAIAAAFGDSANLALQYDGWGKDKDAVHDYSTFYTYAPTLMENIQSLGSTLVGLQNVPVIGDKLGLSQEYDSEDQMVSAFAETITTQYPSADAWVDVWMAAKDGPIKNGFGLSGGREMYSAARLGYNKAFISYLIANNASEACITAVNNYVEGVEGSSLGLPLTICDKAFVASEDKDLAEVCFGGDSEAAALKECKDFYDDYKNSEACRENGRTFYNTMVTIKDTSAEASNPNNAAGGYFEYYDNYLDEMSGIYTEAQELAGNGIMIIVTMENGEVNCQVSPSAADLRAQ